MPATLDPLAPVQCNALPFGEKGNALSHRFSLATDCRYCAIRLPFFHCVDQGLELPTPVPASSRELDPQRQPPSPVVVSPAALPCQSLNHFSFTRRGRSRAQSIGAMPPG